MEIFRKKNEATVIAFPMVTTANPETFDTGETVTDTAYFSDAGGAWTSLAITDTVSEIGTTGMYELSLTAAEMNHDNIIIKFSSTNAADTAITIRTRAVDLDDLVRATTPGNTLDVDANGDVNVAAIAANAITATAIATDAITNAKIAAGAITASEAPNLDAAVSSRSTVAATDIVSAGAITTLAGAVVNVDTVDTCTTNTDMRGTDNALLAASAPANFSDLAITITTGQVTVGTNTDKTGYSISGTKTTLDALNDITTAQVNTEVDTALTDINLHYLVNTALPVSWTADITANSALDYMADNGTATYDRTTDSLQALADSGGGGPTAVQIADAVWDEVITAAAHNVNDSGAKYLRELRANVSYPQGAIYIDTINGVAGSTDYENGTPTNPTNTITNANTLATSLGISSFIVLPGSSITFGAVAQTNQSFVGNNWTLALGTVTNFAATYVEGATVSGVASGVGTAQTYEHCILNATSHIKGTRFRECSVVGTQTILEAGDYSFIDCYSGVAGAGAPTIDMGVAVGASTLELRNWAGGITLNNLAAGDVVTLDGTYGTITLNGADAQVEIRGSYKTLVNNLTGAPTVTDNAARYSGGLVSVGVNNDKTGYSISGTKTTLDALNDVAATDIVSAGAITTLAGAVVNVDTVDTCTTNTDMRGTDNALLATAAPTNFSDLAITATTGQVTVGTNNDKTGYTASTVTDKTGYSISGTKTTLDALNDVSTTQVNTEVDTALADIGLDHLISSALPTSWAVDVAANSVFDNIADNGTAAFDRTTDSLQAIADSGGGGPTAAQIADAVWDEAQADHVGVGTFGIIASEIADILVDTNELQTDDVPGLIAALNNIAATDIVSAGPITTLAGAVVNVDTVDTCTTNTDMRGTDNALLAASAPTNFSDLAITVTTGQVTVGTNTDKTGYSISGTKQTLDALNDITTAQVNTEVDTALADIGLDHLISSALPTSWAVDVAANSVFDNIADNGTAAFDRTTDSLQAIADSGGGGPTAAQIADAVWDEAQVDHVAAGSFGVIASEIADILVDTAEIGAAGAGLTEAGGTGDHLTALPDVQLAAAQSNTVTFPSLVITGELDINDGVNISTTTLNKAGLNITCGNGNGHGMFVKGLGTGDGLRAENGDSGGAGIWARGNVSGDGFKATGGNTGGHGIYALASTTWNGMRVLNSGGGEAVLFQATSGNHGLSVVGEGVGHGISVTGGASGNDIDADIVGTLSTVTTVTNDVQLAATQNNTVTFPSLVITGELDINDGIDVSATTLNKAAINLLGNGNGNGITVSGGATGTGIHAIGQGGTGSGIYTEALGSGRGMTVASAGGEGMRIQSTATNDDGIHILGTGSSPAIRLSGGNTAGAGLRSTGGGTGAGMSLEGGAGGGHGLVCIAGGAGNDIDADIVGTLSTVTTVTNDVGVNEWNGVPLATTNPLPNAAAGAAGGLPTDATGKTSFNDVTTAQINTEVADVLKIDTNSTDALAGNPPESASMEDMITFIYKCLRNKKTSTATTISIFDDAGTTVDHKRSISDNGTTYTEEEIVTGP